MTHVTEQTQFKLRNAHHNPTVVPEEQEQKEEKGRRSRRSRKVLADASDE